MCTWWLQGMYTSALLVDFTASCCGTMGNVGNMLQALLKTADMKENVTGKSVEVASARQ